MPGRKLYIQAVVTSLLGLVWYVGMLTLITPAIQALYNDPGVIFAPTHFQDARQYVFICKQGYELPSDVRLVVARSRINWMPVYALLQCAVHRLAGISLVFTGVYISAAAIAVSLFFGTLTLTNLGIRHPALYALAALTAPIGAAWLYLPGVEATYLAVGMVIMWLITLPACSGTQHGQAWDFVRALAGFVLGVVFILTKPNPLGLLLPFGFAFLYLSWQYSCRAGYQYGLFPFVADVVIEHLRPLFRLFPRTYQRLFELERRPVQYNWTAAMVIAGILLGFTYWLAYTSRFSGVPFYFLQQQNSWPREWPTGNVGEMALYFAQAFHGATVVTPWRYDAAWYLAANLAPLIPAAARRVPTLIRGMLWLMPFFLIVAGQTWSTDRYMVSTAIVAVGWSCWLAPSGNNKTWLLLRWIFVIALAVFTSYLLIWHMFPAGQPYGWVVQDR